MQFQNISLAHSDLLKWLFWTSRHALLFHHINTLGASQKVCRRLIIHFLEIRSDLDLNMLLHRIPNNFYKLTFAFPASKLWDMPWLLWSNFLKFFFNLIFFLSLTSFKRQMHHFLFLKYLCAWLCFSVFLLCCDLICWTLL